MLISIPSEIDDLATYLGRFLDLIGPERFLKRCDQLDADQRRSFYQWKIVTDYHWLEMAVGFQADVLAKEGRLLPDLVDTLILASLNFAATVAAVHADLSPRGQRELEGRLRDSLKAEAGFAPLYLELDLARRLMNAGYEVDFVDTEGDGQYDVLFRRGAFTGEIECKAISADAGRKIHRKHFYRFMDMIAPALITHAERKRRDILLVTLDARLPSSIEEMVPLAESIASLLCNSMHTTHQGDGFRLQLVPYAECLGLALPTDQRALYTACRKAFGENIHVAGALTDDGGCLVVVRSDQEDDPSKVWLEALRKAATQLTGSRPSFIVMQDHGIEPADLILPHVRRRAGILSYALFEHYKKTHVNAVCVYGFGAVVALNGELGTPGFSIPNPESKFPVSPSDAAPFLVSISDADFAAVVGASPPKDTW